MCSSTVHMNSSTIHEHPTHSSTASVENKAKLFKGNVQYVQFSIHLEWIYKMMPRIVDRGKIVKNKEIPRSEDPLEELAQEFGEWTRNP